MNPLVALLPGLENPISWLILFGLGVLLFGKRLPEVGRSLGKGIMEFKKGLKGLEDDIDSPYDRSETRLEPPRPPQRITATTPKFEDNPGATTAPPKE